MLKLYVRFCLAMLLVLHPELPSPQQDQDLKRVSASYVGSIWGSSTAILWLRWCHLGANFGDFGTVLKATWGHLGPCCFGIVEKNPKIQSIQKPPQNTKTPPKRYAKRNQKSFQNPPSKCSPSGPAATTSGATGKIKGPLAI